MIFSIRTTVGQESLVVDMLKKKLEEENLPVYSLTVLPGLKGYILIEGDTDETMKRAIMDIPHIKGRGIVGGEIKIEELTSLLEAKPLMKTLKQGAKVQLVSGPFKGEKAIIMRVNDAKEEVTVELMEAAVKIPVTIKAESIRLLKD
ncbi:MAG: transcription elongation factor Spt5 [Candidatus Diapherotrites archaeon CG08_land_8_20_14_0_20_34_12]|nr:MAG: transcription elongation factor Spt5 [Candidatus Diapherotrites archaeon CG08_land_8_20_14_0_20_34_12]